MHVERSCARRCPDSAAHLRRYQSGQHARPQARAARVGASDLVVFPHVPTPLSVGKPESLQVLGTVESQPSEVFVVLRRSPEGAVTTAGDLHEIGTIAQLHPLNEGRPGRLRMVVAHGVNRAG